MSAKEIAAEMRRQYPGKGFVTQSEIAAFIGEKNQYRVKKKYLTGLEALGGKRYLVTDVAKALDEKGFAV